MKKLWVIIFLTFFLTGCFDYQELNTRAIISGIAIDYENEEYLLNLEILNNKKSENEENASAKTYYVEGTGQTISEAFSNCHLKIAKEPYYAHLKVVILSESTAKEKLKEVVDYFIREPSVRNIFLPVVSKNAAAKDILENTSKENPVVSTAIQNLILDNKANDTVSVLKDFEVFTEELINPYLYGYINTISKEEDTLYLAGIAVFKNMKLATYLDEEETSLLNVLKGQTKNYVLNNNQSDNVTAIGLYDNSLNLSFTEKGLVFKTKHQASLLETTYSLDLRKKESYEQLQREFEPILKDKIAALLQKLVAKQIDLLEIQNTYYKKYKKTLDNWYTLKADIETTITLNKNGLTFEVIQ